MKMKLSEIADFVRGELIGDPDTEITGVSKIEEAKSGEITFLANKKYFKFAELSQASAIIVPQAFKTAAGKNLICTENPYYAFLKLLERFYPPDAFIEPGIHPSAVIAEDAEIGEHVSIGAHTVVGRGCSIGNRTVILPNVVINDHVKIGEDCLIHALVSLRNGVSLGDRVVLHNGVVIGSDGFGFAPQDGKYYKIPQVGTVIIEDDVEIGANTTVDRATMGETRIKAGAKIDNLVQIAHNCTVGENTVIAAQAGLSGSTHIGKGVRVGGQVGFAGHITIGDHSAIGAQSGVSKDVPPGVMVSGYPAKPHREELRIEAAVHKLPEVMKEFKELKEKIKELEKRLEG